MRSTFAPVVVVLVAAGLASGQDKGAKAEKYVSKEGKFSVTFPEKPAVDSKKIGALDITTATAKKGAGGYTVVHADLPPEVVKLAKPKDLLDGGQQGIVGELKGKTTSAKDFEFGKQKYPAREVLSETDTLSLRIQMILAENRLYQVFVVGPKDMVSGKDADAFFKSFEITK